MSMMINQAIRAAVSGGTHLRVRWDASQDYRLRLGAKADANADAKAGFPRWCMCQCVCLTIPKHVLVVVVIVVVLVVVAVLVSAYPSVAWWLRDTGPPISLECAPQCRSINSSCVLLGGRCPTRSSLSACQRWRLCRCPLLFEKLPGRVSLPLLTHFPHRVLSCFALDVDSDRSTALPFGRAR